MKNKNKKVNFLKFIIISCILLLVIMIILIIILNNHNNQDIAQTQIQLDIDKKMQEQAKELEKDVIISKLADMDERDRIEYYFSKFIKEIEAKEYEKAYDMLYGEFKENYFPTYNDFEEYAKKTFPKMLSVEHTNFERSGDVYILFVTISDLLSGSSNTGKEMRFVVKEEGLNNFVMSFSAI